MVVTKNKIDELISILVYIDIVYKDLQHEDSAKVTSFNRLIYKYTALASHLTTDADIVVVHCNKDFEKQLLKFKEGENRLRVLKKNPQWSICFVLLLKLIKK